MLREAGSAMKRKILSRLMTLCPRRGCVLGPTMTTTELRTGRLGSPTRLVCAGGQSSSLTPNVPVAVGFFSNVFLIILGIPFLHVPLSFGGLVSSFDCCAKKKKRQEENGNKHV